MTFREMLGGIFGVPGLVLRRILTPPRPPDNAGILYVSTVDGKVYHRKPSGSDVDLEATGSGAPTDSQYVTLATDATLSNERVLTAGTGISVTDAGAGSTVTVAAAGALLNIANNNPVVQDYFGMRVLNTTIIGWGIADPGSVAGTASHVSDAAGIWLRSTSGAVAGNPMGFPGGNYNFISSNAGYRIIAKIRIPTSIADLRVGLFVSSATMAFTSDTPSTAAQYVGLVYRDGTDTGWRPVSRDGTTFNANASQIGTVAADTVYFLLIETAAGTSYTMSVYSATGTLIASLTHSANLPSVTQNVCPNVYGATKVNSAKIIDTEYVHGWVSTRQVLV